MDIYTINHARAWNAAQARVQSAPQGALSRKAIIQMAGRLLDDEGWAPECTGAQDDLCADWLLTGQPVPGCDDAAFFSAQAAYDAEIANRETARAARAKAQADTEANAKAQADDAKANAAAWAAIRARVAAMGFAGSDLICNMGLSFTGKPNVGERGVIGWSWRERKVGGHAETDADGNAVQFPGSDYEVEYWHPRVTLAQAAEIVATREAIRTGGMKIINLTPHTIRLNDGTEYPPSGTVARVAAGYTEFDTRNVCRAAFGAASGVPDPESETLYVVSGMVSAAMPDRADVVAPATGHPQCVRRDGQVWSVPGFVK
jgi:hypothetical protein